MLTTFWHRAVNSNHRQNALVRIVWPNLIFVEKINKKEKRKWENWTLTPFNLLTPATYLAELWILKTNLLVDRRRGKITQFTQWQPSECGRNREHGLERIAHSIHSKCNAIFYIFMFSFVRRRRVQSRWLMLFACWNRIDLHIYCARMRSGRLFTDILLFCEYIYIYRYGRYWFSLSFRSFHPPPQLCLPLLPSLSSISPTRIHTLCLLATAHSSFAYISI